MTQSFASDKKFVHIELVGNGWIVNSEAGRAVFTDRVALDEYLSELLDATAGD